MNSQKIANSSFYKNRYLYSFTGTDIFYFWRMISKKNKQITLRSLVKNSSEHEIEKIFDIVC